MKNLLKKLQMWDMIWSVPLTIIGFVGFGMLGQEFFTSDNGETSVGFYDPSFIHAAFMAWSITVMAAGAALGGWYFYARGLFKYFYGKDQIKTDFQTLPAWLKISFAFLPFVLFLVVFITVLRTVLGL